MSREHLTFAQAAKLCPGRPHASALWRWARKGLPTRSGSVVKLRVIAAGRKLFTTKAWLDEFFAAKADADTAFYDTTPKQYFPPKAKRHDAAMAVLERDGI
jgi:hypothetical protein